MVYISLSTTTDVIGLVFRPGFMHCSLRDYIGVMCASRLGGFDLGGINVASTTTLCIAVSSGFSEQLTRGGRASMACG